MFWPKNLAKSLAFKGIILGLSLPIPTRMICLEIVPFSNTFRPYTKFLIFLLVPKKAETSYWKPLKESIEEKVSYFLQSVKKLTSFSFAIK